VQRVVVGVLESLLEHDTPEPTGDARAKLAAAQDEVTSIIREQNARGGRAEKV
jgi:hypothetical protein